MHCTLRLLGGSEIIRLHRYIHLTGIMFVGEYGDRLLTMMCVRELSFMNQSHVQS